MTAHPEDQPLPLDEGDAERVGRPPGNSADDGKSGGESQGGKPARTQFAGAGSGNDSDRSAPGAATHKKADDIK